MSHTDFTPDRGFRSLGFAARARTSCERRDLADWAVYGGALPARLAEHVSQCPDCADQVRRVNRVHASLTLMRTQPVPLDLVPRANGRALRMLRRVARGSSAAARLLRISAAEMSVWQRAYLHLARLSLGVAAAGITLVMRLGLVSGFEHTRSASQRLATHYCERQSEETGEWFGRA